MTRAKRRDFTAYELSERVQSLRSRAEHDPRTARDLAVSWIRGLADAEDGDVDKARTKLNHVFRTGAAEPIDGVAEVTLLPLPPSQRTAPIAAIAQRVAPLRAKEFDAATQTGSNILHPLFGAPLALALGGHRHRLGCSTLEFQTRIEQSVADAGLTVLALDHGAVAPRAGALLGRIRDEAVRIVPGVWLLKGYIRLPNDTWQALPLVELLTQAD